MIIKKNYVILNKDDLNSSPAFDTFKEAKDRAIEVLQEDWQSGPVYVFEYTGTLRKVPHPTYEFTKEM